MRRDEGGKATGKREKQSKRREIKNNRKGEKEKGRERENRRRRASQKVR